jgi:hypothetical protein
MQYLSRILITLTAAGIVAWPAIAARDKDAVHDGFILEQNTELVGGLTIICSAKGVKATSDKKSVSVLCVAPFTEVVLFSDRTKKYHATSFKDFRCPVGSTLSVVNSCLLSDIPTIKTADASYKKMKVHAVESTPQFTQKQVARFNASEVPGRAARSMTAYSTDDLRLPPQIGQVLERFLTLPNMPGMPVFAQFIDLGGDKNNFLTTTSVKKGVINDSAFSLPPTYKKVAKHEDLFVGADTADEMGLMMMGH